MTQQSAHAQNVKTQNTTKEMQGFLNLLRELQKIDPEFPLQYAVCLAEISLNEGLSVTDLSRRTGMALSTVSRIVGALSKYRQMGEPYELVALTTSQTERRRKEITLTPKGRTIVSNIAGLIMT